MTAGTPVGAAPVAIDHVAHDRWGEVCDGRSPRRDPPLRATGARVTLDHGDRIDAPAGAVAS